MNCNGTSHCPPINKSRPNLHDELRHFHYLGIVVKDPAQQRVIGSLSELHQNIRGAINFRLALLTLSLLTLLAHQVHNFQITWAHMHRLANRLLLGILLRLSQQLLLARLVLLNKPRILLTLPQSHITLNHLDCFLRQLLEHL